jgi:hypothetical protein
LPSNPEFHIFRDSRRRTSTPELVGAVRKSLRGLASQAPIDSLLNLLLQAGELECALSDAGASPEICEHAARLTDLFADAAIAKDADVADDSRLIAREASSILDGIQDSSALSVSVPEGFAYYALHPLDYADLIARSRIEAATAMVVGIRSIGTTLSSVVAAKLRAEQRSRGFRAPRVWLGREKNTIRRFTVRPTGHPYDRQCMFDPALRANIADALAIDAMFLVCDEGPGRSGSSLLSVAEALEREGVPRSRILILCAHDPNIAALCAPDAEHRWSRYRVAAAGMTKRSPANAAEYFGSGEWRTHFFSSQESWPAVWPQMERLRYRSADDASLLAFEGHGPYGAAVRERQQALSNAGFGLPYLGQDAGFGRYQFVKGRLARANDISTRLLKHMAEYCAWRARAFTVSGTDTSQLEAMARVNYERQFGVARDDLMLAVERPVICDSRMMPQEWLRADDGRWLKLNPAIHGDDHFFPGPCDIAWDLAGTIVEWNLPPAAREYFLAEYRKASGDDPMTRIAAYESAYAVFRMAWSAMAGASVGDAEEESRLLRDYDDYRNFLRPSMASDLREPMGASEQTASLGIPELSA